MWARTCHVMWLTIHRQHSGVSSLLPSWVLGLDSGNQVCVANILNRLTGPQTLSFDPELQVFQAWILLIFTHEHCKTPVKNPSWRKSASILASSWALQMFFPQHDLVYDPRLPNSADTRWYRKATQRRRATVTGSPGLQILKTAGREPQHGTPR